MIEALKDFPDNVVAISCSGHVTQQDYETVLEPAAAEALGKHEKVRVYYQVAEDFTGYDPGALWEDFKVGMGNFFRWERVAVVTDVSWIAESMKAFSFLMPCDVKVFPVAEAAEARAWIVAD